MILLCFPWENNSPSVIIFHHSPSCPPLPSLPPSWFSLSFTIPHSRSFIIILDLTSSHHHHHLHYFSPLFRFIVIAFVVTLTTFITVTLSSFFMLYHFLFIVSVCMRPSLSHSCLLSDFLHHHLPGNLSFRPVPSFFIITLGLVSLSLHCNPSLLTPWMFTLLLGYSPYIPLTL